MDRLKRIQVARQLGDRFLKMFDADGDRTLGIEGHIAGEHAEQHDAEAVEI